MNGCLRRAAPSTSYCLSVIFYHLLLPSPNLLSPISSISSISPISPISTFPSCSLDYAQLLSFILYHFCNFYQFCLNISDYLFYDLTIPCWSPLVFIVYYQLLVLIIAIWFQPVNISHLPCLPHPALHLLLLLPHLTVFRLLSILHHLLQSSSSITSFFSYKLLLSSFSPRLVIYFFLLFTLTRASPWRGVEA